LKRTGKSHIKGKHFLFSAAPEGLDVAAQNGAMSLNQKRLFFPGFTVGAAKELLWDGGSHGTFVTATQELGPRNGGLQGWQTGGIGNLSDQAGEILGELTGFPGTLDPNVLVSPHQLRSR
jgi:hypothetical protein